MGADCAKYWFRYKEREPKDDWKQKAITVAAFAGEVLLGNDWQRSYEVAKDYKIDEEDIKDEYYENVQDAGALDISDGYCSIDQDDNVYGFNYDEVSENMTHGMKKFFPEFSWELHYYIRWGLDIDEFICGSDGITEYRGGYSVILPEEDDEKKDYDFSIPPKTEDNPYPCPKFIKARKRDPDAYNVFWMNPKLNRRKTYPEDSIEAAKDLPREIKKARVLDEIRDRALNNTREAEIAEICKQNEELRNECLRMAAELARKNKESHFGS